MIELHEPKTVIGEVTLTSKTVRRKVMIKDQGAFLSLSEEVGELATELAIKYRQSDKKKGPDGIKGECADVIICAIDIMALQGCSEDEIIELIKTKNKKWREKKS